MQAANVNNDGGSIDDNDVGILTMALMIVMIAVIITTIMSLLLPDQCH